MDKRINISVYQKTERSGRFGPGGGSKMQKMIEFRHVRKAYGEKVILEDFNLCVEKGEFVTIIGSSGCGKTTVLKMINGLLEPDGGEILIEGENIREKDQTMLRRNIGYAIQGSVLFPHMTVEQNIAYVPNLLNSRDKKKTREVVSRWMGIVGLRVQWGVSRTCLNKAALLRENDTLKAQRAFAKGLIQENQTGLLMEARFFYAEREWTGKR